MTVPLAQLPFTVDSLEVDVAQMERMVALLKRKAELQIDLVVHGVVWDRQPTRKEIVQLVARRRGLTPAEMSDRCNNATHVHARHEAIYLMRIQKNDRGDPRWSWSQCGEPFGLDHTSAMNGYQRHRGRLKAAGVEVPE